MRSGFQLSMLLCFITVISYAQEARLISLNIGDPAPPLRVDEWLKGKPVQSFEKGNVYVLEFWATWCKPCKAAMPHLSALANEYKNKVTIIGIDVYETKNTSLQKIKAFVDSMGNRMDYHVATQDSNFIVADWIEASGEKGNGIPRTFVINAEGKLAWIGHPTKLAETLAKIVDNTWNIDTALANRNLNRRLAALDDSLSYELMRYDVKSDKPGDFGKPDSVLFAIDEIIRKEPGLTYAPHMAYNTFSALLKRNPHKAYEYGKMVLITSTYDEPASQAICDVIKMNSDKLNLSKEIYELGAEAHQAIINRYPEIANVPKHYHEMAECYWRANNKSKAIEAEEKAIEAQKNETPFSAKKIAELESQLQQYKKM